MSNTREQTNVYLQQQTCKRQLRACCAGESLLERRQSAASLTETEDDGISDKFKVVSGKRHSRQKRDLTFRLPYRWRVHLHLH